MQEEWHDIVGYEGLYQVSDLGRVRSLDRTIQREDNAPFVLPGRILKCRTDKDGYILVTLNGGFSPKTFKVHRLVAQAFIKNDDNLPQVDHINGARNDNRIVNLRWSSVSKNLSLRHNVMSESGLKGVRLCKKIKMQRYQAYAHDFVTKKFIHIGLFDTAEQAKAARDRFVKENENANAR